MKLLLVLPPVLAAVFTGCGRDPALAFLRDGEVYLWEPDAGEPRPLANRRDVDAFFWSPSGRHVAYRVTKPFGDSFWCFTGVDTGIEVKTRTEPLFSAAGRTVAYIKERERQLVLLDEVGGEQRVIAEWVSSARWNPAGTRLAYVEDGDLKVFDLEDGASLYLAGGVVGEPDFVSDDLVLFFDEDGTLGAARADGGAVYRLAEEVSAYHLARDLSGRVRGTRLVCVDRDRDAYLMDFDGVGQSRTGTYFYRMAWDEAGSRFFLVEEKEEKMFVRVYAASGERLLELREPWDAAAADSLAWGSGELAYTDADGSLYVMDLAGSRSRVAREVLDFAWVPHRRRLVVLMPRKTVEETDAEELPEAQSPPPVQEPAVDEAAPELDEIETEEVLEEPPPVTPEPAVGEPVEAAEPSDIEEEAPPAEEERPVMPEPAAEELVEEIEEPDTAVFLYDLDGGPRRMLARSARLPLLSPSGDRFLYLRPLQGGDYEAVVASFDGKGEHRLGRFREADFPAQWQPEEPPAEGRLVSALVTLALVALSFVLIYIVVRRVLSARKRAAEEPEGEGDTGVDL